MKDVDVIDRLNNRDSDAFKYVFDTYYKSIFLFVQKYIPDPDQSEDIVQEVFVSIWEKKLVFKNQQALKAYLYQTARNRAINVLEHEKVKKGYQDKSIQNYQEDDFFHSNYVEHETQRLILKSLDNLPPRAREILHLQLQGLKNHEIAERLKISLYTVKNHKAVAYRYLKENLKELILFVAIMVNILS